MAASVAGRSTLVRAFCRASMSPSSATRRFSLPPRTSNFVPHRSPTSSPPLRCYSFSLSLALCTLTLIISNPFWTLIGLKRLLRRELSSLQPVHSAIASACLVSKLPSEASTSTEGNLSLSLSLSNIYLCMCMLKLFEEIVTNSSELYKIWWWVLYNWVLIEFDWCMIRY